MSMIPSPRDLSADDGLDRRVGDGLRPGSRRLLPSRRVGDASRDWCHEEVTLSGVVLDES